MVSTTINFSGLMCLFLALGPATVLASPQLPGVPVPEIVNHGPETTSDGPGHSETSAGSGVHAGIPDGPFVDVGAGYHDIHRGPCGPGSGDQYHAGAGVNAGIPGGPSVNVGFGEHYHTDGYPCPEPPAVVVPTTTPETFVEVVETPTEAVIPPTEVVVPATETSIPPPVATANSPILPPVYTTPINVPTTTAQAIWSPALPIVPQSTPLIYQAAPSATPSPSYAPTMPVFNAGSSLAPASVLAVAVPIILAFFH
ncbi:hypothetical protein N7475_008073 [Penicillium sp. IBT 31633x]|nr:hypothetical protein N7475_008073 [Penicillium sp. IBT 31633x]